MLRNYAIISILCLMLFMPVVLAADVVPPPNPQQQVNVQQFVLAVQKQNDQMKKDIIANEDENMKQFDARMVGMLSGFLRKLVIGLLGGMMVVLVGYAAIVSYVSNKFTPAFQRNLFRNKMGAAIQGGKILSQGAVVQVQSPIVSQKEGQQDSLKSKSAPLSTYKVSDEPEFSGFDFSSHQTQQTAEVAPQFMEVSVKRSGLKKILVVVLVLVFVVLAYLSVRYYLTHMGVSVPSLLGNLTGGV